MEALILAAGRGERMRPLTDHTPKPLLQVAGVSLIERHITNLAAAGHRSLVVNHAHLGERLIAALGDGSRYGAHITYSAEPPGALDTGGGILQALSYMRGECFAVVNGDIWTDFPFSRLPSPPPAGGWLVLVDNPAQHPQGDFSLDGDQVRERSPDAPHNLTFAGIAVYHRGLFQDLQPGRFALRPILLEAVRRGTLRGTHYRGRWHDVGTPERLAAVRESVGGRRQP